MDQLASERVCYVHCNFCSTILAVSVPCSSMFAIVTVRCGHCATLLSVNMGAFASASSSPGNQLQPSSPAPPDNFLQQLQRQHCYSHEQGEFSKTYNNNNNISSAAFSLSSSPSSPSSSNSSPPSSSSFYKLTAANLECPEHEPPRTPPIRPPEKRQRVPSAYNKFIKEEIQRLKARNPEISHREAFSLAAKNWAHFPRLHFGLNLEGPQTIPAEGALQKSPGFH